MKGKKEQLFHVSQTHILVLRNWCSWEGGRCPSLLGRPCNGSGCFLWGCLINIKLKLYIFWPSVLWDPFVPVRPCVLVFSLYNMISIRREREGFPSREAGSMVLTLCHPWHQRFEPCLVQSLLLPSRIHWSFQLICNGSTAWAGFACLAVEGKWPHFWLLWSALTLGDFETSRRMSWRLKFRKREQAALVCTLFLLHHRILQL